MAGSISALRKSYPKYSTRRNKQKFDRHFQTNFGGWMVLDKNTSFVKKSVGEIAFHASSSACKWPTGYTKKRERVPKSLNWVKLIE